MNRPRTIQIYLPSGDPRGIRVAALVWKTAKGKTLDGLKRHLQG